jgi:hypothetical protein
MAILILYILLCKYDTRNNINFERKVRKELRCMISDSHSGRYEEFQQVACSTTCYLLQFGFLLPLFFDPEKRHVLPRSLLALNGLHGFAAQKR